MAHCGRNDRLGGTDRILAVLGDNDSGQPPWPAVGCRNRWPKRVPGTLPGPCLPSEQEKSFVNNSWSTFQQSNRAIGRIGMTIETIRMQVRGLMALVAELRLVFVAPAATAQGDFVANSIPHSFIPQFPEQDPVVLPHPVGVSDAALRSCRRNL